ncbi:hypothetical protein E4U42_005410 [Claviceps africana]|uniref:Pathogenesis-related protein NtPRp27 n=1 Tax=Claviceps africana TaxID=83212 RepID=A0A8K0J5Z1_9HYPO|nr:hypothetical protein E4U42_005410 [Claviceps africana]
MSPSPPQTTPAPEPLPLAASPAAKNTTAGSSSDKHHQHHQHHHHEHQQPSPFPQPKLRLQLGDVTHPGAKLFLSTAPPSKTMTSATADVLRLLYHDPSDPSTNPPPTRSVTLILRDMGGVAYTTGSDLDDDHKEIHFALNHISPNTDPARAPAEIAGVLTHELVHCFQWNARGTCPGGLIEGVADWVRLHCGLEPPHWKRGEVPDKWDKGYQHTAYFLDYLEQTRFGCGFVRRLNEKLRLDEYDEKAFWFDLTGSTVGQLFEDYVEHLRKEHKAM